jgi:hypothetical protein
MTALVAGLNLLLGVVYTCYGVMTAIEMKRDWRAYGFSHFGAAWVAMAFTCGPHHLFHGLHQAFEGRPGGPLDLVAVLVGLPVGAIWFLLRVEAFVGGRGDRFISGTPRWLKAMPATSGVYVAALGAAAIATAWVGVTFAPVIAPNIALAVIYVTIGYFLLRTQLRNRAPLGGWSVSGVTLMAVFPTCALMHVVFITYFLTKLYQFDVHSLVIDSLGVPAGLYFLLVVRALYRRSLHDWNEANVRAAHALAS